MNYKLGDYISSKNGKLVIANDKKGLIKLAKKEVKEWIEARDGAQKEIYKWQKFLNKAEESK